jgi:hypothetical protein
MIQNRHAFLSVNLIYLPRLPYVPNDPSCLSDELSVVPNFQNGKRRS